jgi:hypothetical protein
MFHVVLIPLCLMLIYYTRSLLGDCQEYQKTLSLFGIDTKDKIGAMP